MDLEIPLHKVTFIQKIQRFFFSRIQVLLTKYDLKSSFNSGLEIWIVHLADGDSSD